MTYFNSKVHVVLSHHRPVTSSCAAVFVGNHCTHVPPTDCTYWGPFEAGWDHDGAETCCNAAFGLW